jgi:hypothetical protein
MARDAWKLTSAIWWGVLPSGLRIGDLANPASSGSQPHRVTGVTGDMWDGFAAWLQRRVWLHPCGAFRRYLHAPSRSMTSMPSGDRQIGAQLIVGIEPGGSRTTRPRGWPWCHQVITSTRNRSS